MTPVFHAMENFPARFPRHGKNAGPASAGFSTPWKMPPFFSTPWKMFPRIFHAMENFLPHRGKSGKSRPPPSAGLPRHGRGRGRRPPAIPFVRRPHNADVPSLIPPPSAGRGCRGFLLELAGASRENNRWIFQRCRFADDPSWTRVHERSAAKRQNGKDAGWFSRRPIPKEILSSLPSAPPRPAAA